MLNRKGLSFVELIVVLAIAGTLLSLATMNFSQMQRKAKVDQVVRELHTDINTARLESVYKKAEHRLKFGDKDYELQRASYDDNGNIVWNTVFAKKVVFQLKLANGAAVPNMIFNIRGMTTNQQTIVVSDDGAGSINCIVVSTARTNLGKMTGDKCVQR